jgi:hypothetical protein
LSFRKTLPAHASVTRMTYYRLKKIRASGCLVGGLREARKVTFTLLNALLKKTLVLLALVLFRSAATLRNAEGKFFLEELPEFFYWLSF